MLKPVWAQKNTDSHCKNGDVSQAVVAYAFIPTLKRWRQMDLWARGQPPDLPREFQDSQDYREKPSG